MVFELGNRLGHGGYGSVYEFPNTKLNTNTELVLKVFKPENSLSNTRTVFYDHNTNIIRTLDFLYQLKAANVSTKHILFPTHFVSIKKLIHSVPNVSFNYQNNFQYGFIMPKLHYTFDRLGVTTNTDKHKNDYTIFDCQKWLLDLLSVIKTLNKLHFAHCDITANNIMFDHQNELYLIDYDLITWFGFDKSVIGKRKVTQCTTRAPEGFFYSILNNTIDVYSLGVIFTNLVFKAQIFPFLKNSYDQAKFLFNHIPHLHFNDWHLDKEEVEMIKQAYDMLLNKVHVTRYEFYHSVIRFITLYEIKHCKKVLVTPDHIEMLPLLDQMTEPNAKKRASVETIIEQLEPLVEKNKKTYSTTFFTESNTNTIPTIKDTLQDMLTTNYCVINEIIDLTAVFNAIPKHFEYYYTGALHYRHLRESVCWWIVQISERFSLALETTFVCVECLDIYLEKTEITLTAADAEFIALAIVHIACTILHHSENQIMYEDLAANNHKPLNVVLTHILNWKSRIVTTLMGEFRYPLMHGIECIATQLTREPNMLNILLMALMNEHISVFFKNDYKKIITVVHDYLINQSTFNEDLKTIGTDVAFYNKVQHEYIPDILIKAGYKQNESDV
jgi:serine/threonine protein kinase